MTSDPSSKYYFWVHALFDFLSEADDEFSLQWEKVPKVSAIESHYLQEFGIENSPSPEVVQHVENLRCNVYKLNRRLVFPESIDGTMVGFLIANKTRRLAEARELDKKK